MSERIKEQSIQTEFGKVDICIHEYTTPTEIVTKVKDFINDIEYGERVNADPDLYVYVEYNDGSIYHRCYNEAEGKFKTRGLKCAQLDDGYEYFIFGDYEINEETGIVSVK